MICPSSECFCCINSVRTMKDDPENYSEFDNRWFKLTSSESDPYQRAQELVIVTIQKFKSWPTHQFLNCTNNWDAYTIICSHKFNDSRHSLGYVPRVFFINAFIPTPIAKSCHILSLQTDHYSWDKFPQIMILNYTPSVSNCLSLFSFFDVSKWLSTFKSYPNTVIFFKMFCAALELSFFTLANFGVSKCILKTLLHSPPVHTMWLRPCSAK